MEKLRIAPVDGAPKRKQQDGSKAADGQESHLKNLVKNWHLDLAIDSAKFNRETGSSPSVVAAPPSVNVIGAAEDAIWRDRLKLEAGNDA